MRRQDRAAPTPAPTAPARLTGGRMRRPRGDRARDAVALVLAVGLVTAINLITFALLYDAIVSEGPGLSENATQVMTGAFGGIIGVLGSYVGYRTGQAHERQRQLDRDQRGGDP
jgi:hypothetical protein